VIADRYIKAASCTLMDKILKSKLAPEKN